jgi:hypothetical protein
MWKTGTWHFHHENAQAHTALPIREFLAKHPIPVLPKPPFSPELTPSCVLYPPPKMTLKGRWFQMAD